MEFIDLFSTLAGASTFCSKTKEIWALIGTIVNIIRWVIPALIILLGTIDLAKAVIASKDDEIKKAQGIFIKRIIYGIIVFFVILIVQGIFAFVGKADDATGSGNLCLSCVSGLGSC